MKKILAFVILTGMMINLSCKKFIDVNTNPNAPVDVQESFILPAIELNISTSVAAGTGSIYINHFMQNIALNQPVPNEGTYLFNNVDLDVDWNILYVNCLNNLININKKAEESGHFNYSAISKVLTALCLNTATDWWGDVPYSQAFLGAGNFKPAYDKQEDLYKNIQLLLDNAITDIAKNSTVLPKGDDLFYKGDMAQWKRLAYTLKARYYMRLTKAPGYTATTQADLALSALQNGMSSNGDDLKFAYPGGAGQENQLYQTFLPISTLVLSEKLVNDFVARKDPRIAKMIAPAKATGKYNGRPIGATTLGSLEDYSLAGPAYASASSPLYIVNYSEALFLKAEATLIKSNALAAQPFYQDGIKSHMLKLGVSNTDVAAYLTARGTLLPANALQFIIEEKNIANFLSIENYNDWRRTGYPNLIKVPNALSDIPRRLIYPQSEILSNPQPLLHTAKLTDKVWWDK